MKLDHIKTGMVKWRVLLVIGALVSLCLSDSVGPRLMPLPISEAAAASVDIESGIDPTASRAPSRTKGSGPRVEMTAATQNRAGARHQQVQSAAHAPQTIFKAPAGIILRAPETYGPLFSFAAPVSRPPGRAPPRLV